MKGDVGLIRKVLNKRYRLHKERRILPILNELEKNQYLTCEEIENLQKTKLSNILKIAVDNVPYYDYLKKESAEIFSDGISSKQMLDKFQF